MQVQNINFNSPESYSNTDMQVTHKTPSTLNRPGFLESSTAGVGQIPPPLC